MLLPTQIKQFLQEPKFYWMATRNQDMLCDVHRLLGVQIAGPDSLRAFAFDGSSRQCRENLQANKLIAFSVTSGFTFESYQIKGKMLELRPSTMDEELFMKEYIGEMEKMLLALGFTIEGLTTLLKYSPGWSIEFSIDQIFDQTPKVGTGKLLTVS